jgi:hypothetical protein
MNKQLRDEFTNTKEQYEVPDPAELPLARLKDEEGETRDDETSTFQPEEPAIGVPYTPNYSVDDFLMRVLITAATMFLIWR